MGFRVSGFGFRGTSMFFGLECLRVQGVASRISRGLGLRIPRQRGGGGGVREGRISNLCPLFGGFVCIP